MTFFVKLSKTNKTKLFHGEALGIVRACKMGQRGILMMTVNNRRK